jgi:hypothetical protein
MNRKIQVWYMIMSDEAVAVTRAANSPCDDDCDGGGAVLCLSVWLLSE